MRDEAASFENGESMAFFELVSDWYEEVQWRGQLVSLFREIFLGLPMRHPGRTGMLNSLASVLWTRFGQTNQITLHWEALRLRPAPHPDRYMSLNNLANILDTRFSQTSQIKDIDDSTTRQLHCTGLPPAHHPDRSMSLNNLGAILYRRFSQTGRIADVDEAIALHREAPTLLHYETGGHLRELSGDVEPNIYRGDLKILVGYRRLYTVWKRSLPGFPRRQEPGYEASHTQPQYQLTNEHSEQQERSPSAKPKSWSADHDASRL
jgi:hypothetical protein